jgi:hypothetical protein
MRNGKSAVDQPGAEDTVEAESAESAVEPASV